MTEFDGSQKALYQSGGFPRDGNGEAGYPGNCSLRSLPMSLSSKASKTWMRHRFGTLYDSLGLAMTFKDFLHIQNYFRGEERRDPSMTEIRVLDTYWSDHCRHTTFSTELTDVTFGEGDYKAPIVRDIPAVSG